MSLRVRLALAIAVISALVAGGISVAVYQRSQTERLDRARDTAARQLRTAASIYVRQSFLEDRDELEALRDALIRITAIAAVIGALLGVLVASAMSARIRRSAQLAKRLADGDLDARLNPRGTDEIAALGRALDEMADSLSSTIRELDDAAERERRFSADVAHELRTPITGLVAASSLLDDSPDAVMVKERARALATLVEDLLEVMRLDAGAEEALSERFDLMRLVQDVVRDRLPAAAVTGPLDLPVQSDPRRLERVLVNLIENARRHGRAPFAVEVDGAALTVTVRDGGDGFGPFLEQAADRFAMASRARGGGTGLGLAIAEGQARVLGGELVLRDEGGAVAVVRLPPSARVHEPVGVPAGGPA